MKAQRDAVFQKEFREDLKYWVEADRKVALRVFDIVEAVLRDPFTGIGKPEPLKYLPHAWSQIGDGDRILKYKNSVSVPDLPTVLASLHRGNPGTSF